MVGNISSTGTLRKDNDDGSENACKKMNLRSFKLNHVYLGLLNMSNAGDFSWSWILKDFHVVVVQWTSKKCTKKRDARAELLFWSLNLLLFWSRRSCLSSLITAGQKPATSSQTHTTESQLAAALNIQTVDLACITWSLFHGTHGMNSSRVNLGHKWA